MKKPQIALIGAALICAAITTPVTGATMDLPQYGFTIEALDAPPSTTTATTALITFFVTNRNKKGESGIDVILINAGEVHRRTIVKR